MLWSSGEAAGTFSKVGKRGRERMAGRKEKERRKKIGGAHRGKMVISLVGLTLLARNMDKMAHM
jgi:hypothetical protein